MGRREGNPFRPAELAGEFMRWNDRTWERLALLLDTLERRLGRVLRGNEEEIEERRIRSLNKFYSRLLGYYPPGLTGEQKVTILDVYAANVGESNSGEVLTASEIRRRRPGPTKYTKFNMQAVFDQNGPVSLTLALSGFTSAIPSENGYPKFERGYSIFGARDLHGFLLARGSGTNEWVRLVDILPSGLGYDFARYSANDAIAQMVRNQGRR